MDIFKKINSLKKYNEICKDTIKRTIINIETKYPKLKDKELIKKIKEELYDIHLKFFKMFNYDKLYNNLKKVYSSKNEDNIKKLNLEILKKYDSNRAQSIDEFYDKIFEITNQPKTIIDIGCGLNFLTLSWMKNNDSIKYTGYDIGKKEIIFLNKVFNLINKNYKAILQDCLIYPPKQKADISFLFKISTCLEWQNKNNTVNLIKKLNSKWIVISLMMRSRLNQKGCENYFNNLFGNFIKNKKTYNLILKKEYFLIIKNF